MINEEQRGNEKVFGIRLERASRSTPACLDVWMDYLMNTGMDEEGIFRLSGQVTVRDQLKNAIDHGESINYEQYTAHDVAGILKLYFRELPDPLFTYDLYSCFMTAVACKRESDSNLEGIKSVLEMLPPGHKLVLQKLIIFLLVVIEHNNTNKMGSEALARIFAPTLIRPPKDDMETTMADCSLQIALVKALLDNYEFLFEKGEDEISEKTKLKAQKFKTIIENKYLKNEVDMTNKFAMKMSSRYNKIRKASNEQISRKLRESPQIQIDSPKLQRDSPRGLFNSLKMSSDSPRTSRGPFSPRHKNIDFNTENISLSLRTRKNMDQTV